jgi:uncharacterized protein (TIGR03067 family)
MLAAISFVAADEPKKDDTPSLKGNWTTVSIKVGGQEAPAGEAEKMKFSFDDKSYTNSYGDQLEEGGYTVDASKTPNTIDFDIKKGPDAGKKQLGIFKLDGDKLTIVVAQAGSTERPKLLKPEDSEQMTVAVLARVKG